MEEEMKENKRCGDVGGGEKVDVKEGKRKTCLKEKWRVWEQKVNAKEQEKLKTDVEGKDE